nr:uncharacterized protein LOC116425254 [Nomia melanderi]XP_031828585.1 uncharacterized protein LOC116425254 [Nomia melanderi]XP_031828586.1 uncharacterized protein LOC116425254 [Nomia melanderi]XP_031828587.1 uncharacterized protein LOC116425254 [Nomia melanderi]XP_031828588.1 uncharacterized protein LOC116425254 [Nomia melanderi]XP_031828589.1 uncharacterized protein LOC116425254 [Nomia melanderi]XP_031828591.1 uncharacterized protein LOC116425254 [Nomia melanderi]XP_031828592.1 uncharacte
MAWGYWSATSVSDRGRSPRREKDKQQSQGLHQQQQQQQQFHQGETGITGLYGVQQVQGELGVGTSSGPGGAGAAVEEPPCSMMIQGGSFYSYSAALAAATAAAASRKIPAAVEGPSTSSTGIQVLPRERPIKSSTSTYPPSPSSDSAEYEQPIVGIRSECSPNNSPRDDIFVQPGSSSSRMKLLCEKGVDDTSEVDLDDVIATEMMYATSNRAIGTNTCRVHGPCSQPPDPASSLIDDTTGSSQFWFNDITWVFPNVPPAPGMPCQGEDSEFFVAINSRKFSNTHNGIRSAFSEHE